jgi:hypothetical protein
LLELPRLSIPVKGSSMKVPGSATHCSMSSSNFFDERRLPSLLSWPYARISLPSEVVSGSLFDASGTLGLWSWLGRAPEIQLAQTRGERYRCVPRPSDIRCMPGRGPGRAGGLISRSLNNPEPNGPRKWRRRALNMGKELADGCGLDSRAPHRCRWHEQSRLT